MPLRASYRALTTIECVLQSKSVDLVKQRCAICRGKLKLLGQMNHDGTPAKAREPSAFAKYVQAHYSTIKASTPGASHKQLMEALGQRWREGKGADSPTTTPKPTKGPLRPHTEPAQPRANAKSVTSSFAEKAVPPRREMAAWIEDENVPAETN